MSAVEHSWVIYGLRLGDDFEYRYVGLTTVGPTARLRRHIYSAGNYDRPVSRWVLANKDSVNIDILETCPIGDEKYLSEAEQFWISQIQSFGHRLTNLTSGGELGSIGARWILPVEKIRSGDQHPMFGSHQSEEAKKHLSDIKTGTVRSKESRKKQGDSIRGSQHWAYGTTRPDEHRNKISDSLKGRKLSDDHRMKISKARKGIAPVQGAAAKGLHSRWHSARGIVKDDCMYCEEIDVQGSN